MLIEYHRTLLADAKRNAAFLKALKTLIVPGKTTVADIGSGTGFLGLSARAMGAREVWLFESGPVMQVAPEIAKASGIANGCHFIPAHSSEFLDPPKADIVVSETLGNYPFEEHIAHTLNDAKRFLKKGGTVIPQAIRQYACPVVSPRFHRELASWDKAPGPLDFSPARRMSLNNAYIRSFRPADLLNGGKAAKLWDSADLTKTISPRRKGAAEWALPAKTAVYGLALWWDCDLIPGVTLSTAPAARKNQHWQQLYFPFMAPLRGKRLAVTLATSSDPETGTDMRWTASADGQKPQVMDLRNGYLG